ncbi:hypothetical protein [Pedobacter nyackensis]|uniref:hypothetical protein n=1 Tax=Pedobacter nyackensis TaxID=475255 RepID=UPI00292F9E0B|nr:hypothetical protein [Pedobacter nyackensis]
MKQLFLTIFILLILNDVYAQVKATSAEINTGTDDDKFATALALQGSKYLDQNGGKVSAVTSAGANTYIASIIPGITAYSMGQVFYIKITTANTGASTLNLNGLGAKVLVKDASTALVAGDLLANKVYTVYFDGTNFQVMNIAGINSTSYIVNQSNSNLVQPGSNFNISGKGTVGERLFFGASTSLSARLYQTLPITGGAIAYGLFNKSPVSPDVTDVAHGFRSEMTLSTTSQTLTNMIHYTAAQLVLPAGSAVTTQTGFYAHPSLIGATNNYGFYGLIPAGTGRYNLYMAGNAVNYLNGSLGIGTVNNLDIYKLNVVGETEFTGTGSGSPTHSIRSGSNTQRGLTVRGFSPTQTANLQEWQNSSGTVISSIDNAGRLNLLNAPITSTGTYDLLTRNTTTGAVEKVASSMFAPATGGAYLPLTGGTLQSSMGNKLKLKKELDNQPNYVQFTNSTDVQTGYVGHGGTTNDIALVSNAGNISLYANGATRLSVTGSSVDVLVPMTATAASFSSTVRATTSYLLNGAPATIRSLAYQTNNVNRWYVYTDQGAETGSNVGSNFNIARYSDAGVYLSNALIINRASGNATFSNTVTAPAFVGPLTGNAATASAVAWSGVTSKPTNLAGYGITDAATQASVSTLDANVVHKTGNETITGTKLFSTSVGIGTTNVHSYKLAVGGGIIAESVKVKPEGQWPDYVFEKDYPILPLNELEMFVSKNKHLPNVPNAAEVKKDGIDVGEMNAKLLQKIEELTLYIIEQQKNIIDQQKSIVYQQKGLIDQQKEIKDLKTNELRLSKEVEKLGAEMNLLKKK